MIKIILADDHDMFRAGLKELLGRQAGFKVIGQAKDGEDLLRKLATMKPDCVVMDLFMPNMDGLTALKKIHKKFPKIKVLILTMQKDIEHFKHAMSSGATGYLLKEAAFDDLVQAIKDVMQGKAFVSDGMRQVIAEHSMHDVDPEGSEPSLEILTSREKDILRCIAQGKANKDTAQEFKISIRTVETHRSNLIRKLGLKTPASLVKYAMAKGIV